MNLRGNADFESAHASQCSALLEGAGVRYLRTARVHRLGHHAAAVSHTPNAPREHQLIAWPFHAANVVAHLLAALIVLELLTRAERLGPGGDVRGAGFRAASAGGGTGGVGIGTQRRARGDAWTGGHSAVRRFTTIDHEIRSLFRTVGAVNARQAIRGRRTRDRPVAGRSHRTAPAQVRDREIDPMVRVVDSLHGYRTAHQLALQITPLSLPDKSLVALDALGFYLCKLLWPMRLASDYGRTPELVVARGWNSLTWIVPIVLIAAAAVLFRRSVKPLVASALFVVALVPMLGLLPFDFQAYSTVADHYAYLALFGAGHGGRVAGRTLEQTGDAWVCGVVCLILAVLSFARSGCGAYAEHFPTDARRQPRLVALT